MLPSQTGAGRLLDPLVTPDSSPTATRGGPEPPFAPSRSSNQTPPHFMDASSAPPVAVASSAELTAAVAQMAKSLESFGLRIVSATSSSSRATASNPSNVQAASTLLTKSLEKLGISELDNLNWRNWAREVRASLHVAGVADVIERTISPIAPLHEITAFANRNAVACSLIRAHIGNQALQSVLEIGEAKELWDSLFDRFGKPTKLSLTFALAKYHECRMDDGESWDEFISNFLRCRNEVRSLDNTLLPEGEVLPNLLSKLPQQLVDLHNHYIEDPKITLDGLITRISNYSRDATQRQSLRSGSSSKAFFAGTTDNRRKEQRRRGSPSSRGSKSGQRYFMPSSKAIPRPDEMIATQCRNWQKWPHGLSRDGLRFKAGRNGCWNCFEHGTDKVPHTAKECTKDGPIARRMELEKSGVIIPSNADIFGLVVSLDEYVFEFPEHSEMFHDSFADDAAPATGTNPNSGQTIDAATYFAGLASEDFKDGVEWDNTTGSYVLNPELPDRVLAKTAIIPNDIAENECEGTSSDLYLDSGATYTMVVRKSLLHNYTPFDKPFPIKGAFNCVGHALGFGTLHLRFENGSSTSVDNVLLVPRLGVNLVSMRQLVLAGHHFEDYAKRAIAWSAPDGRHLTYCPITRNAVIIKACPSSSLAANLALIASSHRAGLNLWHRRLGHASEARVRGAAKVVDDLQISRSTLDPCDACALGKAKIRQKRKPSTTKATRKLDIVYSDVWGPAPVEANGGYRYAVGFIDLATSYTWVHGLKSRDEVSHVVPYIVRRMQEDSKEALNIFQSDNAKEFLALRKFFETNGTLHRTSTRYAHGQQGKIERPWLTLFDMVRTALLQAELPPSLWLHCLRACNFARNLTPTKALPDQVPSGAWNDNTASAKRLRVWGCDAIVAIPSEVRGNKLTPRGLWTRFVGYSETSPGWDFFVPSTRKIISSPDAKFFEDRFGAFGTYDKPTAKEIEELVRSLAGEDQVETESGNEGSLSGSDDIGSSSSSDEDDQPLQRPKRAPKRPAHLDQFALQVKPPLPVDKSHSQVDYPVIASSDRSPSVYREEQPIQDEGARGTAFNVRAPSQPPGEQSQNSPIETDAADKGLLSTLPTTPAPEPEPQLTDLNRDKLNLASWDDSLTDNDPAVEAVGMWVQSDDTPTFKQAVSGKDRESWEKAMHVEAEMLKAMGTWDDELVELPAGVRAIGVMWRLLIKRDKEGQIVKFKARLCARGDQQASDNFEPDELYAPTPRMDTWRAVLALTATHDDWELHQFDFESAYLHADLKETVYIRQAPGFIDHARPSAVRRLRKCLYGLRQSGHDFNSKYQQVMTQLGFKRFDSDHAVFIRERDGKTLIVPAHVDDGVAAGNGDYPAFLAELRLHFKMKDLGEPQFLLGMTVTRNRKEGTIRIDQRAYAERILERFGMADCKPSPVPINTKAALSSDNGPIVDVPALSLIGALMYLALLTRPDLLFYVVKLSRFSSKPTQKVWIQMKHLLRYLKGTLDAGIVYSRDAPDPRTLFTYCDADHAGDIDSRKSTSGFITIMAGGAIAWTSKLQDGVTTSSLAAEYVAYSLVSGNLVWLRLLLREFGATQTGPSIIYGDNKGAIILTYHQTLHDKTKHVAVHYHYAREQVQNGTVVIRWIPTSSMVADALTKPLDGPLLRSLATKMGLSFSSA